MTITLKLIGRDGNAFNMLALANAAFRKAGAPAAERQEFMAEATQGNYDHMLATILGYAEKFGVEVE